MADIFLLLSIWVHVLSAIAWLGSSIAVLFILIPHLIANLDASNKVSFDVMGKRLALIGQASSGLILITGIYQTFADNVLSFHGLFETFFGNVLLVKVFLYVVFAGLSEVIAARLKKLGNDSSSDKVNTTLNKIKNMEFINIVIGILIIIIAVFLRYNVSVSI